MFNFIIPYLTVVAFSMSAHSCFWSYVDSLAAIYMIYDDAFFLWIDGMELDEDALIGVCWLESLAEEYFFAIFLEDVV